MRMRRERRRTHPSCARKARAGHDFDGIWEPVHGPALGDWAEALGLAVEAANLAGQPPTVS